MSIYKFNEKLCAGKMTLKRNINKNNKKNQKKWTKFGNKIKLNQNHTTKNALKLFLKKAL